ncbi:hypothetical protein EX30DRAFT_366409 [Ascodesmis nigricans]|uniref:Vacuolar protein sorting-associated protein 51 homolog n=1 Tax=Ascodesmis nigricans TaxID=341454 RepID=A0A4S2MLC0_9PEZI|nr:hypothetical protein EX30DRAFT_366409 [Ascodesmis nigricans]
MPLAPSTSTTPSRSAALRDFYNLPSTSTPTPESHITTLLSTSTTPQLLTAENALIDEMRSLDAERKALVYDNYSKLIAATETIRRMTSTALPGTVSGGAESSRNAGSSGGALGPAVAHIEDVAGKILRDGERDSERDMERMREGKEAGVVRWVVEAPGLVERLRRDGREEDARRVWERLREILGVWERKGVKGVEEVRRRGEKAAEGL